MSKGYARFLTALFCLFLGGLMVWQFLLPDRERSDVENRTLQQAPVLTLSGVLDGSYMEDVESYVQDQFPLRDEWTGLKARTEQLIGKRLFNNIYLCEGETLISKVDAPADGLEETNLNYVTRLPDSSITGTVFRTCQGTCTFSNFHAGCLTETELFCIFCNFI